MSPFVLCRLVDLFDVCFVDFARRLVVDGLLRRVDKPPCRPLPLGMWSSVATTFHAVAASLSESSCHRSVEDDVVLVLTSIPLFCQYIAATKVGFTCCFVLIHYIILKS